MMIMMIKSFNHDDTIKSSINCAERRLFCTTVLSHTAVNVVAHTCIYFYNKYVLGLDKSSEHPKLSKYIYTR